MEEEKNVDITAAEQEPAQESSNAQQESPEQEFSRLVERMQELVSTMENRQAEATPTTAIAEAVNKAVEFRPMEVDERSEVEKFLERPDGPLARYYGKGVRK